MPRFGINKKYFWGMGTLSKLPGSTSIPKTKFKRHLRPYWKDDILMPFMVLRRRVAKRELKA